ncbi:MAG: hypothetical protein PHY48_11575 [Candidatus Cloacimonetes bacterium]|nr:hypothetical protein [Candidatus Cloacimonadota bacterium]
MNQTMKGLYNSSITRVRPFFRQLYSEDRTGDTWLPKLLLAMPKNKKYSTSLAQKVCKITPYYLEVRNFRDKILGEIPLERCFEYSIPPSKSFVKWLIENPHELSWPNKGKKTYREETQISREQLLGMHGRELQDYSTQDALKELERFGVEDSKKKWWAFEGFTEMDCLLETDDFLLGIEGKRTEPISPATSWFPQRNQIIRNLEVLKEKAGNKEYALILLTEDGMDPITDKVFEDSLPHCEPAWIIGLQNHYLGSISWSDACKATGFSIAQLPNSRIDTVRLGFA